MIDGSADTNRCSHPRPTEARAEWPDGVLLPQRARGRPRPRADRRAAVRPRQRLGRGPAARRAGERLPRAARLGGVRRVAPRAHRRRADGTKARYGFVYGDFRRVHRTALIACHYRAAEWRHKEVELAAHDLLQELDAKRA